jgi:hypothetical protein
MLNLNYKPSLFNGFSLEYSLCRYKYILKITNELKKINLSDKFINTLIQSSIQDINYESDIILYLEKDLLLYSKNKINKKDEKYIKFIFRKNINEFNKEVLTINKFPSVILKPSLKESRLIVLDSTTNYIDNNIVFIINNHNLIRLIKLFFICNKKSFNLSQCLNHIYHLFLLYKSIGLELNNNYISKEYSIISTPLIKRKPYTYFSVFPFIERMFGSLGFFKHEILITNNTDFNLKFLNDKLNYKNVKIFKYKNTENKLIY